jgi:hypothetical protein
LTSRYQFRRESVIPPVNFCGEDAFSEAAGPVPHLGPSGQDVFVFVRRVGGHKGNWRPAVADLCNSIDQYLCPMAAHRSLSKSIHRLHGRYRVAKDVRRRLGAAGPLSSSRPLKVSEGGNVQRISKRMHGGAAIADLLRHNRCGCDWLGCRPPQRMLAAGF